ncbi:hypothetical protein [Haloferula luteola]|uniref:hypothetical protein n=1 Tax=Haloferula luteola TaxID=595692 RepID=UPI001C861E1E|nr:hypothetical protein [Haloferula luteola]
MDSIASLQQVVSTGYRASSGEEAIDSSETRNGVMGLGASRDEIPLFSERTLEMLESNALRSFAGRDPCSVGFVRE